LKSAIRGSAFFSPTMAMPSVPAMLEVISTGTTAPFSAMSGALTLMSPLAAAMEPTAIRSSLVPVARFQDSLATLGTRRPCSSRCSYDLLLICASPIESSRQHAEHQRTTRMQVMTRHDFA
jgi:hypothetical protein